MVKRRDEKSSFRVWDGLITSSSNWTYLERREVEERREGGRNKRGEGRFIIC